MEERQRVKIVDYVGSKKVEMSKIDEKLKEANAQIRLDTFIDPGLVRKVEGIVRDMMQEKGFQFAEVTPRDQGDARRPEAGAPHLQHGRRAEGQDPARSSSPATRRSATARCKQQMKENKAGAPIHPLPDLVHQPARRHLPGSRSSTRTRRRSSPTTAITATSRAHVGVPELKVVDDSKDKKTRWVELRIPITEGPRYKVGNFDFAGNTVVKTES